MIRCTTSSNWGVELYINLVHYFRHSQVFNFIQHSEPFSSFSI
jgi:hypothetical protein